MAVSANILLILNGHSLEPLKSRAFPLKMNAPGALGGASQAFGRPLGACPSFFGTPILGRFGELEKEVPAKAISQTLWPGKDREVWFSLGENHEKASRFGLHHLRNCHGREKRVGLAGSANLSRMLRSISPRRSACAVPPGCERLNRGGTQRTAKAVHFFGDRYANRIARAGD
jgi:hypothetical protein